MRVQGLVTLWGLGLFNEVVICLQRGSPLNPKFTVSSCSVYKLFSASNKNGFFSYSPHAWEWYVRYNDVFQRCRLFLLLCDATSTGFVYVRPVANTETYACGSTVLWGPNANCILVGSWRGRAWRPKEVAFCLTRVCLCSHFLRLLKVLCTRTIRKTTASFELQRGDWKHDLLRGIN